MNVTLNLPDEMAEQLKQIAQTNHVSIEDVLQVAVTDYVNKQLEDKELDLAPENQEEFRLSLLKAKAEMDAGVFYTQEQINQKMRSKVRNFTNKTQSNNGIN